MKKASSGILIVLILFLIPRIGAAEGFIDYHGITTFYGENEWTNIGPDAVDDYKWYGTSYAIGHDIYSWLSIEMALGAGYLDTKNFDDTATTELRFLMDAHYKFLYFKLGGGVTYLFDPENIPDLSGANYYAIAGIETGFRYQYKRDGEGIFEIKVGYGYNHLSDPFKGGEENDNGWNTGGVNLSVTWIF